ncbi:unnamed protein product [Rangifer tarandus platyrhynchus]|uniref:Uncharacterized protein n=3 Tax=Rangifer tarandus platyrhynchus TaxID=3082113 RepID=A0ABN8ZLG2_RANTA|nr:unnamed protein product [Rangifer tarandus platyrhynchus]CAI9708351.1 unnamed protein product [Rangifer tarandus platyrhynchus]
MSRGPSIGAQDRTGQDEEPSPDRPGDSMKRTCSMCATRSPANKEYMPRVTPLTRRKEKVKRTGGHRAAASGAEGRCRPGRVISSGGWSRSPVKTRGAASLGPLHTHDTQRLKL